MGLHVNFDSMLPFTRVVTVAVLQPARSGTLPGGLPSAIRDIRLRRNWLLLSASEFCATTTQFAQYVLQRTARFVPRMV